MSPKATTEVLIGTGTLYLAPTGTAFPADPTAAPAVAWVDVGYSDEGWSFNVDRNVEDVNVAEELDPIDVLQTSREIHVVGASAQASLENIKTAMGGGTISTVVGPPAYKRLVAGTADQLERNALLLRVKAPGTNKNRDIQIPTIVSVAAIELGHRKAPDKSLVAMDFRALKVTGSNIFEILDAT